MDKLIDKLVYKLNNSFFTKAIYILRILRDDYGYFRTVKTGSCIDPHGNPIPWYTYPAIEYIRQLNFEEKYVFEYGLGNSSLFWSKLSKKVISVDNNKIWYEKIFDKAKDNMELIFFENKTDYVNCILDYGYNFDVIIIDADWRLDCAKNAIKKLNQGGLIILDNSDWFTDTAEFLRHTGLIQVDMAGFGPINSYTWTTSLFFSREFSIKSKDNIQPLPAMGSIKCHVDEKNESY